MASTTADERSKQSGNLCGETGKRKRREEENVSLKDGVFATMPLPFGRITGANRAVQESIDGSENPYITP